MSAGTQNRLMDHTAPGRRGAGPPQLTAVCVTWNSTQHLPGLLESLDAGLAGLRWRLVVVDNGSTDGTPELLHRLAPSVELVQTGRNLGYAAAINRGLPSATGSEVVLVLNPDVRLGPGCGVALVDALRQTGTGIAVPVQRDPDGSLHATLRREPTVLRALGEALLGGWRADRVPTLGELVTDHDAYAASTRADWATGSVMAVSQACLTAVGNWDETFFLYSEETDFALRARDRGFELRLVPRAACEHLRGASHDNPQLWALLTVNRLRLFAARHGAQRTLLFRAALLLGEGLRSCGGAPTHLRAVRALLRGERAAAALIGELASGSTESRTALVA